MRPEVRILAAAAIAASLAACNPKSQQNPDAIPTPPGISTPIGIRPPVTTAELTPVAQEQGYTVRSLQSFGAEMTTWQLSDGTKMADLYPDAQIAANLLEGKTDPQQYLPSLRPPINLSNSTSTGALGLEFKGSNTDHREFTTRIGQRTFTSSWQAPETQATFYLSPSVENSVGRIPVLMKEAYQLIHATEFQKVYLDLVQKAGVVFTFLNPKNTLTSEAELLANYARAIQVFEEREYGYSTLSDFIDTGSRLLIIPVMETQRLDLVSQGDTVSATVLAELIQGDAEFLKKEGLIKKEGGKVLWIKPPVIDKDFYDLFVKYSSPMRRPILA